ncbi:MAG: CBS domain-containing protein [Anaerolineales bacterium]|nr:CBS domain-containing protein [Anaerolineales bacterium]
MAKLVRDYMHPGVITCRPDATLGQVAVMLVQHQVHSLVVIDRDSRPIGILTDFDLLAGEWLSADKESLEVMRKLSAGDLMSSPVELIDSNQPISEAAQRMHEGSFRRLIVADKGKMIGVISVSDIIASLGERMPAKRDTVGDVMSDAILVCRENTPLVLAARAMTQTRWRSVVVVDAHGTPLGVVSGLDFLPYCNNDDGCNGKLVSDIMHPALTIPINASLREAADKLIENHYHRLIVIDQDHPDAFPLGVISSFDIVAEMARPGSVWQA